MLSAGGERGGRKRETIEVASFLSLSLDEVQVSREMPSTSRKKKLDFERERENPSLFYLSFCLHFPSSLLLEATPRPLASLPRQFRHAVTGVGGEQQHDSSGFNSVDVDDVETISHRGSGRIRSASPLRSSPSPQQQFLPVLLQQKEEAVLYDPKGREGTPG